MITDVSGNLVWAWDNSDPFGNNVPNENPSGLGVFEFNKRFSGQYFDKETNTHYNYFRDYDPATGRYIQSDPIGLRGGINTFIYVGGNPLRWFDPKGLDYGFSVDSAAAGGNGHTTLYFQNGAGDWYAYNQYATGEASSGGDLGYLLGLNAPAGVNISPIASPPDGALIYPTTDAQDVKIVSCAVESENGHNSGKDKYNLYSNNCTDASVDVMSCAGISVPNPAFTIRPNSWVEQLPQPPVANTNPAP